MNRPTKFEVMRRNRRVLAHVVAADEARDVEAAWAALSLECRQQREDRGEDTADWLRDTREEARRYKPLMADKTLPPPRRGLLRRVFNYCTGVGRTF